MYLKFHGNERLNVPFASKMFCDDGNKPFQTAKYRPVNHDGSSCGLIGRSVLQVESFGKLEVKLDSSTLE